MAKKPAKKTAKPAKKVAKKTAAPKAVAKPAAIVKVDKFASPTKPRNTTGSYTLSEFVENVRGFCGMPKRTEAKEMIEDIARLVRESLKRGYKLPLFGLGKMYVRESKARQARNPQTGAIINIPARKRVRFSAAKALKEAVLK